MINYPLPNTRRHHGRFPLAAGKAAWARAATHHFSGCEPRAMSDRCANFRNFSSVYPPNGMEFTNILLTNMLARGDTDRHASYGWLHLARTRCSKNVPGGIEQHDSNSPAETEVVGSNPTKRTISRHEKAPWLTPGGLLFGIC